MDAAEPDFLNLPLNVRLDKTDAVFVDATHSNGGEFGLIPPLGHVDFYLNGGKDQPGCPKGIGGALSSLFGGGGNMNMSH